MGNPNEQSPKRTLADLFKISSPPQSPHYSNRNTNSKPLNQSHPPANKTDYVTYSSSSSSSSSSSHPKQTTTVSGPGIFTKVLSSTGLNIASLTRIPSYKRQLSDAKNNSNNSTPPLVDTHPQPSINHINNGNLHHTIHHELYDVIGVDDEIFDEECYYGDELSTTYARTNTDGHDSIIDLRRGDLQRAHHIDDPPESHTDGVSTKFVFAPESPGANLSQSDHYVMASRSSSLSDQRVSESQHQIHHNHIHQGIIQDAMAIRKEQRKVKFRDSIHYMVEAQEAEATKIDAAVGGPSVTASNYHDEPAYDKSMDSQQKSQNPFKSFEEEFQAIMQLSNDSPQWDGHFSSSIKAKNDDSMKRYTGPVVGLLNKGLGLMKLKKKNRDFFSQDLGGGGGGGGGTKKTRPYFSQELGASPLDLAVLAKPEGHKSSAPSPPPLNQEVKPPNSGRTWHVSATSEDLGEPGEPYGHMESRDYAGSDVGPRLNLGVAVAEPDGPAEWPPDSAASAARKALLRRGGGRRESRRRRIRVNIEEGMIGLGWEDGVPVMLSAGTYEFVDSYDFVSQQGRRVKGFYMEKKVSDQSEIIVHGNLNRVRIKEGGHLGVAWVDGQPPILLHSGSVSLFSCKDFKFITSNDEMLSRKEFTLGPFRIITVAEHEIGVKFVNRQPQVLKPGRHYLSMSKLEVFAGFESLLKRKSTICGAIATSKDDMKVLVDIYIEWQINAEDATFARLANIIDVEAVVCEKTRRAFHLAMWETNVQELQLETVQHENRLESTINATFSSRQPSSKIVSSKISSECLELFEEGWTITIWDLQLSNIIISLNTPCIQDNM